MALIGPSRRLATGANAVLVALLVTAITAVVVELGQRHRWRADLSVDGRSTLAPDTAAVLQQLEARGVPVQITAFSSQHRSGEGPTRDRAMLDFLRGLGLASARIEWRFVDFDRDRLMAETMGVDRYGTVVVEAEGDRVDLLDRKLFRSRGPAGERELDLLAEGAIVAAIRQLLAGGSDTLVLLSGHGERDIFDRGIGELRGLAALVEAQGWSARTVDLLRDAPAGTPPAVPDDASVVLILGSRAALTPAEDDAVRDHLRRGGGLGVFADPGGAVPTVMVEGGMDIAPGVALDLSAYFPYADRPLLRYGAHPITEELSTNGIATVLAHAAPLVQAEGFAPLLKTSPRGWVELGSEQPAVYTEAEDQPGPVVVAAAANLGGGRVVLVGDVDLVTDALLDESPGNAVFVTSTVRWLMGSDEAPPGIARPAVARRLALTVSQLDRIRWALMGLVPLLVLAVGAVVRWQRRPR